MGCANTPWPAAFYASYLILSHLGRKYKRFFQEKSLPSRDAPRGKSTPAQVPDPYALSCQERTATAPAMAATASPASTSAAVSHTSQGAGAS